MDINSAAAPRTTTVMIVDDELFFRELLRDMLQQAGFMVVAEAVDGMDAVDKYFQHRPDITVMDIFMPGENGIVATKEIISRDKDAKVLICSGIGYDDDIRAAMEAGARDVVVKPFFANEVIDTINKAIGA